MYVIGTTGDDVNEYNLSTAWDVSTSTYSQNFSFAAQETNPRGIYFKDDGTKMYISGVGSNAVNEYNLSTAWDVTTASYSQNFSVLTQENNNRGLFFKSDGTKMYLSGTTGDAVYEYNLSTAWDVSSATYNQNFSVANEEATVQDVFLKPDGTRMFITGQATEAVYAYNLSTAYDVSTASIVVPEANLFNLSEFSYTRTFSVSAQQTVPLGLTFKDDGTKMYIIGSTNDDIDEYNLSTAWNISTATYSQTFSVATQDTAPQGLYFKSDGTEMYVVGSNSDAVFEYNLSTAWDISTASYASNTFSVASQDTAPLGLFFKDDGTKMYIMGAVSEAILEYDLSTAWDVSTSTYSQEYDGGSARYLDNPSGVYFKPDGTKVFVVDSISDAVFTFNIGVQE
jgi:DNA-binding beta-propeller fold protein YncE